MTVKPVVALELANRDIEDAIAHHISEGAEPAALGVIDALEQAYAHICRHPATGSPRYARELNLLGLRFRPPAHDRHHMFYVWGAEHIDVWRELHGQRDIPAWMQEPENI